MRSLLIILPIFVRFSLNLQLNTANSYNFTNLINDCLKFTNNEQITYATSSAHIEDFKDIFENQQPHIIYNFNEYEPNYNESNQINYDYYIIFDENLTNFNQSIYGLFAINNLHVHGKYLVIIQELLNRNEIADMFEWLFQEFDIYNIILMNNQTFFTWFPYKNNCNNNIEIHEIASNDLLKHFNSELLRNLNKCKLRVVRSDIELPMVVSLIQLIGECLNATIIYIKNESLDAIRLFAEHGHLNNFNDRMRQMNITLILFVANENVLNLQFSAFIFNDVHIVLELPPRRLIPKWREFKVFSDKMTLFVAITIIISALVYALMTKQSIMESFFRMYQLSLQLSLNTLPKEWKLRIYVIFLMFFVVIVSSAYLSVLSGVFTRPSLEPKITTLQQFFESDIPLKASKTVTEVVKTFVIENKRKPWPKEKFIYEDVGETIHVRIKHKSCARFMSLVAPSQFILQHSELLPVLPRNPASFAYRRRLHLDKLIDYYIRNIDEMGFMDHYMHFAQLNETIGLGQLHLDQVTVLTMVDLSGVFIIWLYGLAVAGVVFTYEIIDYKRQLKLRRVLST